MAVADSATVDSVALNSIRLRFLGAVVAGLDLIFVESFIWPLAAVDCPISSWVLLISITVGWRQDFKVKAGIGCWIFVFVIKDDYRSRPLH